MDPAIVLGGNILAVDGHLSRTTRASPVVADSLVRGNLRAPVRHAASW
jgi:hypothetical protein